MLLLERGNPDWLNERIMAANPDWIPAPTKEIPGRNIFDGAHEADRFAHQMAAENARLQRVKDSKDLAAETYRLWLTANPSLFRSSYEARCAPDVPMIHPTLRAGRLRYSR